MPPQAIDKRAAAREVIDILEEIAILLVRTLKTPSSLLCASLSTKSRNTSYHPRALDMVLEARRWRVDGGRMQADMISIFGM